MNGFNVTYDKGDGTRVKYTFLPITTFDSAKAIADTFIKRYVGQPYPNGKGYYEYRDVRIEPILKFV